jgi:O-antigen/teichoic acid export membrane protein
MIVAILFIIVNNLMISKNVDRMYPEYKCCGKVSSEIINNLKTKVAGLLIGKICYTTRNAFDNIFVSMFLGLTVTAMYSNYYYIMSSITGLLIVIISSLLAGVGNSIELDSVEKNYYDMQKIDYIYMLLSGWCTVCLVCLYQPFMKLWVGETYMFSFGVVCLFSLYFYVLKMGDIRSLYSDAAGLFWENRYRTLAEAILNIILNYVFVVKWGVYGIIAATIITMLIMSFIGSALVLFKNYFKFGRKQYFLNHLRYFLITTFVVVITYWCCSFIQGNDYIVLIVRGIICCIVAPILYLLFYGRTNQFKESVGWLIGCLGIKMKN